MNIKKQSVMLGSVLLMISVIVSKIAGLFLKIPLANMLGGTGMGYYSGAYAVFMPLYSLCAASLPPAIACMVAKSSAFCRHERIRKIKRVSLLFFSAISLVMTALPIVFADFICVRIIGNPEAKLSVIAIAPCIFFGTVTAILRGYYEGLKNMTPTALSQMSDAVVKLVSGLGLAYLTKNYAMSLYYSGSPVFGVVCMSEYEANAAALPYIAAAAVLGTTLADLAGMATMLIYSRLDRKNEPNSNIHMCEEETESSLSILKSIWAMIAPIAMASLVSSLLSTIDLSTIILLIKKSLRDHPEQYTLKYSSIIASGVKLSELPNFLYGSFTGLSMAIFTLAPSLCAVFGKSVFPAVSECYAKSDSIGVSKEIRRAICSCTYISIPAGLGLCAFSLPILKLLFSSRYAEISVSHIPLSILSLGTAFLSVSACAFSILQAIGRQDLPVKITLVGAIVKLVLNSLLIPIRQSGLAGASAATVLSYLVMCLWSLWSLYNLTGTKPRLVLSTLLPLISSAISVSSSYMLYKYLAHSLSNALSVAFSVFYAVIIYILLIVLLDISTKNKLSAQFFD